MGGGLDIPPNFYILLPCILTALCLPLVITRAVMMDLDCFVFKKNFTNRTHTRLHSLHFRHHVHAVWKPTLLFQICDMVMNRGTSCCFKRPTGVKSNELLRHPVITMHRWFELSPIVQLKSQDTATICAI